MRVGRYALSDHLSDMYRLDKLCSRVRVQVRVYNNIIIGCMARLQESVKWPGHDGPDDLFWIRSSQARARLKLGGSNGDDCAPMIPQHIDGTHHVLEPGFWA